MAANKTPGKGAKPDKLMRDALMIALKREATDESGQKTTKLQRIADKLVDLAVGGDVTAIRDIRDSVDGKPAQAITGVDGGPIETETVIDASSLSTEIIRALASVPLRAK